MRLDLSADEPGSRAWRCCTKPLRQLPPPGASVPDALHPGAPDEHEAIAPFQFQRESLTAGPAALPVRTATGCLSAVLLPVSRESGGLWPAGSAITRRRAVTSLTWSSAATCRPTSGRLSVSASTLLGQTSTRQSPRKLPPQFGRLSHSPRSSSTAASSASRSLDRLPSWPSDQD